MWRVVFAGFAALCAVSEVAAFGQRHPKLDSSLIRAVQRRDSGAVMKLLAHGADPNARDRGPRMETAIASGGASIKVDVGGRTALMLASLNDDAASVKVLLNAHAKVDARGR